MINYDKTDEYLTEYLELGKVLSKIVISRQTYSFFIRTCPRAADRGKREPDEVQRENGISNGGIENRFLQVGAQPESCKNECPYGAARGRKKSPLL